MARPCKPVAVAERAANRARWERELIRWRRSGQPLSVWAREQGLSRDALDYWKRKLPDRERERLTLIPVAMSPAASAPTPSRRAAVPVAHVVPLELLLGTRRLILPPGFDGESLRRAVAVLETC